jgi:prepilin-type N-terminal cleavage/methylation domain-containing protein
MINMKKGFTLVEMLVAVVLITLLIGVALFAFRLQVITITKAKKTSIEPVIIYENIRASLESMRYYVVNDYDLLHHPLRQLHYFFNGDNASILYISENPLLSSDIAVSKLLCQDNALMYYEEPLYQYIDYLRPAIPDENKPIQLYDNLEKCSFSYVNLQETNVSSLHNMLPRTVVINLIQNKKDISVWAHVYHELNTSKSMIESVIYEE